MWNTVNFLIQPNTLVFENQSVKPVFLVKASSLSVPRNLGKNEVGLVDEICFEDFMTVMSYFKPPEKKLTEEETETVRTAKLRCKNTILTAMTLVEYHSTYTEAFSIVFSCLPPKTPYHLRAHPSKSDFVCKHHKKSSLLPQAGSLYPAWSRNLPTGYTTRPTWWN